MDSQERYDELSERIETLQKDSDDRIKELNKKEDCSQYQLDETRHIVSCNDDEIYDCIKEQKSLVFDL